MPVIYCPDPDDPRHPHRTPTILIASGNSKSPEAPVAAAGRGATPERRVRKGISMELSERIALEKGFLPAPKDHPIYSEGTTITFLRPRGRTKKGD